MISHFPFVEQRRKHFNDVYTVFMCHSICWSVYDRPPPPCYVLYFELTRTFHYARRSTLVDDIIAAIQKVLPPTLTTLSVVVVFVVVVDAAATSYLSFQSFLLTKQTPSADSQFRDSIEYLRHRSGYTR